MLDSFDVSEKKGRLEVFAHTMMVGDDVLVVVTGGRAHIGALAIAQPRPSLKTPKKISATSSVFTRLGHKEDVVAKSMSEKLSRDLNRVVVVAAGIHWDKLKPNEIELILEMCDALTKKIVVEAAKT